MPNAKTHRFASMIMLGVPLTEIHGIIDSAAKFYGRQHRVFFHDEQAAQYLSRRFRGGTKEKVLQGSRFHHFLDRHRDADRLEQLVGSGRFAEAWELVRRIWREFQAQSQGLGGGEEPEQESELQSWLRRLPPQIRRQSWVRRIEADEACLRVILRLSRELSQQSQESSPTQEELLEWRCNMLRLTGHPDEAERLEREWRERIRQIRRLYP